MRSWLAKKILSRNMARLRAGDYRPLLRMDARDVRFRFPGESSWAVELEGKQELERWLQHFVEVALQIFPDEVVVSGFPWQIGSPAMRRLGSIAEPEFTAFAVS
jgi:hypothetical protein